MIETEADTCRKFIVPLLRKAGWDDAPHVIGEQRTFTDGRIVFAGGKARRGRQKRADYLLLYRPDFPIGTYADSLTNEQDGYCLWPYQRNVGLRLRQTHPTEGCRLRVGRISAA